MRKPTFELRHLRAFAAVAEELHFTRAASRLHLAQQALSAQVRHLEVQLGVELLHRTTRRVELTPAGELFYARVQELLHRLDEAVEEVRAAGLTEAPSLAIGYTPTVGGEVLGTILDHAHQVMPGLGFSLCETWTPETVSGVRLGRFDVAIARCPVVPDDFVSLDLRHERIGVILGEASPLSRLEVVPLERLDDLVLAVWPRRLSPDFYDAVMEGFPAHRSPGRHYAMEQFTHETFNGDPTSRAEIVAGRAFYPTFEGHYPTPPRGFVWRPIEPSPEIRCVLFYRAADVSPALTAFVEIVLTVADDQGWLETVRDAAA